MVEVKEKGVKTTKTEGVKVTLEIRGISIITIRLGGRENKLLGIISRIAAKNRHGSHCHLLSSSRSFSLFKGSSNVGLRGVIQRVETNSDIASITRTSGIKPMTIISFGGC